MKSSPVRRLPTIFTRGVSAKGGRGSTLRGGEGAIETAGRQVGFVALRQNKPAFSGRRNPLAFVLSLRRSARRYLSQRDKFYLVAARHF